MNHFELFGIPVSLAPDTSLLKQKYYELSRKYHPDLHAGDSEMEQAEILEKSSQVNKAYKVLQSHDETVKYVLQLKDLLEEEEKYQLPPAFLMEVMELNELLTEAKMDNDNEKIQSVKLEIAQMTNTIYEPVKDIIENYEEGSTTTKELLQVKEYYYKKKYLNRIIQI